MIAWPALFVWSKVARFSPFEEFMWSTASRITSAVGIMPVPFFAGALLAAICLIPAAFLTDTWPAARRALLFAVGTSPLPALLVYASDSLRWRIDLPMNLAFQYGWIVLFNLLFPALLFGGIRKIASRLVSNRRQDSRSET